MLKGIFFGGSSRWYSF